MQIGNYIEFMMQKKGMNKTILYNKIRGAFGESELDVAYNSFTTKLSSNNLSANELVMIAVILELDLNELVRLKKMYGYKGDSSSNELDVSLEMKEIVVKKMFLSNKGKSDVYYEFLPISETECYLISFVHSLNPMFVVERVDWMKEQIVVEAECSESVNFTQKMSDFYKKCIEKKVLLVEEWVQLKNEILENTSAFPLLYPQINNFSSALEETNMDFEKKHEHISPDMIDLFMDKL